MPKTLPMETNHQPLQNLASIQPLCADCGNSFPQGPEQSSLCPKCDARMQASGNKWQEQSGEKR